MIIYLFFCFYSCVVNKNESKNQQERKIQLLKRRKLALVENQNTAALINITQEDDSNIFELLQNFGISNPHFLILKCSRFCLLVTFVFIMLLLYTPNSFSFHGQKREDESHLKTNSFWLLKVTIFFNTPTIPINPTISL